MRKDVIAFRKFSVTGADENGGTSEVGTQGAEYENRE